MIRSGSQTYSLLQAEHQILSEKNILVKNETNTFKDSVYAVLKKTEMFSPFLSILQF